MIYDLNYKISNRVEKGIDKSIEIKFIQTVNNFINKIDSSINNFRFNVSIAHFYELYKFFNNNLESRISNKSLQNNFIHIMKLMTPFTPHLASECLELMNCKNVDEWPKIEKKVLTEIKIAVQINGKTRDIITIKKDQNEETIKEIIINKSKAKKYIENKKINRIIFIKNKIINYII